LAITSSPLNGNWNMVGNRRKEQFPLLSLHLQVNGTQIVAHGDVEVRCPNDPRNASGAKGEGIGGEIAPDGSFTLTNHSTSDTIQMRIRGRVPAEGAAIWDGEYTISWLSSRNCPGYQTTKSFTAARLAPLNGTFSG
jgi:hypothetical protein